VKEEREAPKQILLGAISPLYCVLLSMSIHLETESMDRGASPENPWVFPLETNNPIVAKKRAYEIIDVELPYPDAKIACSFSLHWRTM